MIRYIVMRSLQAFLLVVAITLVVFVILRVTAGDPARVRAPVFARPDVIEEYRKEFGTDKPIYEQLVTFVSGIPRGDLGDSFRYQEPVFDLIVERLPRTLQLAFAALVLATVTATVLGVLSARRPGSAVDHVSSLLAVAGQSAPVFWVGLVLIFFFSVRFTLLPAGGYGGWKSLVLPAVAVALSILPSELRVLRASMRTELQQDYVRTARASGLSERRISFIYALRNACLPLLTVIGIDVGYLLGGAIVAEVVFNLPGIGQLALEALNARDYPLVQGITIVTASIFVLMNLLIDILYLFVDPRIRLNA